MQLILQSYLNPAPQKYLAELRVCRRNRISRERLGEIMKRQICGCMQQQI